MEHPYKQPYKQQGTYSNDDKDAAVKGLYTVALARTNIKGSRMRVWHTLIV